MRERRWESERIGVGKDEVHEHKRVKTPVVPTPNKGVPRNFCQNKQVDINRNNVRKCIIQVEKYFTKISALSS